MLRSGLSDPDEAALGVAQMRSSYAQLRRIIDRGRLSPERHEDAVRELRDMERTAAEAGIDLAPAVRS